MANIGIYGLGYVGSVSAAALAHSGHQVIGVDPNLTKVEMVNAGVSPVVEEGLGTLLAEAHAGGTLSATTDVGEAIAATQISIVCVGTPSMRNGSLNLEQVVKVCTDIGGSLPMAQGRHLVVIRSTVLPGSTENVVIPALEQASGLVCGNDFDVCFNPEFLREGSSLRDFYDPPFTIIGAQHDAAYESLEEAFHMVNGDRVKADLAVAEMVKYASNTFHALKVSFANEIGTLGKAVGVDSHEVMDIFCRDERLNISDAYLRPGFAFGGSCLPKDIRALKSHARRFDLDVPLLDALLDSNQRHIDRAFDLVTSPGHKRIGILGLSFKSGTDDLRESPMVGLTERLLGKGYTVSIYDANVSFSRLHGANRAYIEGEIPHISSLLRETAADVIEGSDVIVIGNGAPEFRSALAHAGSEQTIIDLVGTAKEDAHLAMYEGLCW